jgi:hypothetical protein
MSGSGLIFHRPNPDDHERVMAVMPEWRGQAPLGFSTLPGDCDVNGVPVTTDQGPSGHDVVHFELHIYPKVEDEGSARMMDPQA